MKKKIDLNNMDDAAKYISEAYLELHNDLLYRHTKAVLTAFREQIEKRDEEIKSIKTTLGTLIAWLDQELGRDNAKTLLDKLNVNYQEQPHD